MEMQDMETNEERAEDDLMRKEERTKPGEDDKISEVEKGESEYSKLGTPAEDIYSAPSFHCPSATNRKDFQQRAHLYRGACVILSVLSLMLAVAVIGLCVKLQTRTVCLEKDIQGETVPTPRSCRPQQCKQFCPRESTKVHPCLKCESGWQKFEGSCFYLSRDYHTWAKSKEECRKKAGDLAIIDNRRLQEFLTKKGNLAYWIGLSRAESKEFVWVNNATVGENYWASSQGEGNCGCLIGGEDPDRNWNSSPCSHLTAYICQKDA